MDTKEEAKMYFILQVKHLKKEQWMQMVDLVMEDGTLVTVLVKTKVETLTLNR